MTYPFTFSILVSLESGSVATSTACTSVFFLCGQSLLRCLFLSHWKHLPLSHCFFFTVSISIGFPAPLYVIHRPIELCPLLLLVILPTKELVAPPVVFLLLLVVVICFWFPEGFLSLRWSFLWVWS